MRQVLPWLLLFSACSPHAVHVAQLSIAPPEPMIEPVPYPLYIVLEEVPDEVGRLREVRTFALGPLQATLAPYFEDVVVMEHTDLLPDLPHQELWLRIESIGARPHGQGALPRLVSRAVPTLEWEAVLIDRVSGSVAFEYAASLEGERPMSRLGGTERAWEALFEAALADLASQLVTSGALRTLLDPVSHRACSPSIPTIPASSSARSGA